MLRRSFSSAWLLCAFSLVTLALAALLPLAPVVVQQPVLSWPQAGAAPRSTVVPLVPYRPLRMSATFPCATMDALDRSRFAADGQWADLLRTLPPSEGGNGDAGAERGLLARTKAGRVLISASGRTLVDEQRPTGSCTYRLEADQAGVTVLRDGEQLTRAEELLPPQVAMLETAAEGFPEAVGLLAELETDARFQSSPSPLKMALLVLHGLSLLGCAALCLLRYRQERRPTPGRLRLTWADLGVPALLVTWSVIGPVNDDDGWYLRHALNLPNVGYVGNYYHSFNAPEAPFLLSQYVLAGWASINTSMLWLRLLPTAIGIAVWFLLRWYLHIVLGPQRMLRRAYRVLPYLMGLALLVWWLPFNLTLRPESLVCLGVAATLALCAHARERGRLGVFAPAVVVASLTTLTTATGLLAWGPLLFSAPYLFRELQARPVAQRVAYGTALVASGTAAFSVLFADLRLSDLVETTRIHSWYWFVTPWFQEIERYRSLLYPGPLGNWAKRAAVLLTLLALGLAAVRWLTSRGRLDARQRMLLHCGGLVVFGMVTLAISPTKWVHHFGGLAVPATVLLAVTMLSVPIPATVRRAGPSLVAAAGAVLLTAVIFSGPNTWYAFSDWGQAFGDHTTVVDIYAPPEDLSQPLMRQVLDTQITHLGPVWLNSPLVWAAVLGVCLWLAARARKRQWVGVGTTRFLVLVQGVVVLLLLTVFVAAPIRQYPQWSIAKNNARSVTGTSCGLADDLTVPVAKLTDVMRGPDRPALHAGEEVRLTELLRGQPTFVDWPVSMAYPCVPVLPVTDGMATPSEYRLIASDMLAGSSSVAINEMVGGTQAFQRRVATFERIPVNVQHTERPRAPWGHLERVVYRHPPGRYTLSRTTRVESGLAGGPRLAQLDYVETRNGWLNEVRRESWRN
ncbi:arabinosyltransferase domain-containing protein [Allokutzneria oryzae]|uniref:Arabinosyltransferase domain-containing protein n=1 Tax=Allokutzneria oryzae TaxID=1378989 RepID=A0ABV6A3D0_9PSEU